MDSAREQEIEQQTRAHQRTLTLTLGLTLTVFIAELVGVILTGSLALLVDVGHMLTDVTVLVASTITAVLMRRRPTASKTWGWARLEVITAAAGSTILLLVGGYACIESALRLFGVEEEHVHDIGLMLVFGLIGLSANLVSLVILRSSHKDNLNMHAAFLEVMNDALGSVGVIVAALMVMYLGWTDADALIGGAIALLMIPRAIRLITKSLKVLLEETPHGLDLKAVRKHLARVPGVVAVHDLHASTVATGMTQLSAHIVVNGNLSDGQRAEILRSMQMCLRTHFPVSIDHTTFQIEPEGYEQRYESTMHIHA
ncbi:cation diffusion facilitator family transporter [Bifidobacterium aquikefiricola]|uniref:Cation diffusion facilitator family transporter n=1 Tax=Bifidobacterium aquikefiricola TaxID=3059038 RepID=A0AB39U885_9BIFI